MSKTIEGRHVNRDPHYIDSRHLKIVHKSFLDKRIKEISALVPSDIDPFTFGAHSTGKLLRLTESRQ